MSNGTNSEEQTTKSTNQSWFIGLAGVITALAALITALGGADGIVKLFNKSDSPAGQPNSNNPEPASNPPTPTVSIAPSPSPTSVLPPTQPATLENRSESDAAKPNSDSASQNNASYQLSIFYRPAQQHAAEMVRNKLQAVRYQVSEFVATELKEARVKLPAGSIAVLHASTNSPEAIELQSRLGEIGFNSVILRELPRLNGNQIQLQVF